VLDEPYLLTVTRYVVFNHVRAWLINPPSHYRPSAT
jgi:hypothetical protein